MIFYEAPHKLLATLNDFVQAFGPERKITLCRELTKLHEEYYRTTLAEAVSHYTENPPRGEFVLVLAGAEAPVDEAPTVEDAVALVQAKLSDGLSKKDAVKLVARETGLAKNALYEAVLQAER